MKEVKSFKMTRLLELASVEFHSLALGILILFDILTEQFRHLTDEYQASIDLQRQASNKNMRLVNTDAINEKDKTRDAYISRFFKSVKDFQKSPNAEEKAAANTLYNEVSRFEGMTNYEKNKETGETRKLLIAVQRNDIWPSIGEIGLENLINQIAVANDEFDAAMHVRVEGEAKKITINTREQRKNTEKIYLQVADIVNATALITPSDNVSKCIDEINSWINEYERTINHMRRGGSGNEELPPKEDSEEIEE